jgi:hypothetical protein
MIDNFFRVIFAFFEIDNPCWRCGICERTSQTTSSENQQMKRFSNTYCYVLRTYISLYLLYIGIYLLQNEILNPYC